MPPNDRPQNRMTFPRSQTPWTYDNVLKPTYVFARDRVYRPVVRVIRPILAGLGTSPTKPNRSAGLGTSPTEPARPTGRQTVPPKS